MSSFANLKLKTKLMIGFGIVIVLSLIISVLAVQSLHSSTVVAEEVNHTISVRFARLSSSSAETSALNNAMALYLSPGQQNEENRRAVEETLANAAKYINSLDATQFPEDVPQLRELIADYSKYYTETIVPLVQAGKPFDALAFYLGQMLPMGTEAANIHASITTRLMGMVADDVNSLEDSGATIMVICMGIALVIIGFLIAHFFTKYISRQLQEQCDVASSIANNDLTVQIKNHGSDEIGHLAQAMRSMRNDLSDSLRLVIETAQDLQRELNEVRSSSDRMGSNAKSVESQAITVAAASDEMVSTTSDIARNCESAASLAEQSSHITNDGMEVVRTTVADIRDQSERTQEDAAKIQALADQTQQIGSIVGTIEDIAAQTNLLALNAAIEAARAGEAGRGFAVVADEVRALASRTTKSTQEISQMVSQIQNDANVATQSMAQSVDNMSSVAERASHLEDTLTDVLNHVNQVNGQITQIATAAEQQTTATSEISSNMQNISSAAQQVSADSSDAIDVVARAVDALNALLNNLSRFKLRAKHDQSAE